MRAVRKLFQLSRQELLVLVQAQILLSLTFGGVYLLGVTRWQNVLGQLSKIGKHRVARSETTQDVAKRTSEIAVMVNVAATYGIVRAHCLQRSLVLWSMLARNGIESEVRYGARKANGQIQAHAWVEINGVVLNDETHHDFSTLEELTANESLD